MLFLIFNFFLDFGSVSVASISVTDGLTRRGFRRLDWIIIFGDWKREEFIEH